MRYFAVIDTNVIVSAMLNSKSVPGMVVKLALRHTIVPVLNDEILAEYKEVLVRPKFHLSENDINKMIKFITAVAVFVDHEHIEIELPDPKDRVFYEVTMQKRMTDDAYLVTGNMKHFPKEPFIVTPREMLDIIMKDQLNIEL